MQWCQWCCPACFCLERGAACHGMWHCEPSRIACQMLCSGRNMSPTHTCAKLTEQAVSIKCTFCTHKIVLHFNNAFLASAEFPHAPLPCDCQSHWAVINAITIFCAQTQLRTSKKEMPGKENEEEGRSSDWEESKEKVVQANRQCE